MGKNMTLNNVVIKNITNSLKSKKRVLSTYGSFKLKGTVENLNASEHIFN